MIQKNLFVEIVSSNNQQLALCINLIESIRESEDEVVIYMASGKEYRTKGNTLDTYKRIQAVYDGSAE